MASLSKKQSPDALTLDEAVILLAAKAGAMPARGGKMGKAAKSAKPRTLAKKTAGARKSGTA